MLKSKFQKVAHKLVFQNNNNNKCTAQYTSCETVKICVVDIAEHLSIMLMHKTSALVFILFPVDTFYYFVSH